MKVNEYQVLVVVSLCVIGGVAIASNLKPSPAATDFVPQIRTYSASEFRRIVLYKSRQDVIDAVGKPTDVSDLSGGGQLYTYSLGLPSSSFEIHDDTSGVVHKGAQVQFDEMGQAERVALY